MLGRSRLGILFSGMGARLRPEQRLAGIQL
jgi:hypothetical protein